MKRFVKRTLIFLSVLLFLRRRLFSRSSAVSSMQKKPYEKAPYDIVSQNVVFTSRHNVELAGTLFYPASYCVKEVKKFPGIVIAEGGTATKEMYYWLAEALASQGYVVLTFDYTGQGKSATEIVPGVPLPALTNIIDIFGARCKTLLDVWMDDTQDAITYLITGSPIRDMVDEDKIGLTGHSCGGCATVVVTARDDRVKAASAMAPFDFKEPVIPRARDYAAEMHAENPRPIQIQVGALDLLCPYSTMAYPIYRNSVAPRQILTIANVEHLGYTDTRYLPWFFGAEPGCHEAAEYYTIAWFDYYLKGKDDAYSRITTQLPMIAHMEYDLAVSEK
ncbi:MAG: alpha/beta fold hydrolase [Actinomycetota bacterium]|nr:alpha/beta fold hydrolase [Actinomycetota bacterium]